MAPGSELIFLNDTNNDGKADTHIPKLTGYGLAETHTMVHVLARGPFSQGGLNMDEVSSMVSNAEANIDYSKIVTSTLDDRILEVLGSGLKNIWGFQLRFSGQWWETEAFLDNPLTSTINAIRVVRNSDGTVSSEHLSYSLYSEDKWFSPVYMEFGPGGCLYIADVYNKIVSHNHYPNPIRTAL